MRILVVSNVYPPVVWGGYELECCGAVDFLRSRGDDVLVLTSRCEASESTEDAVVRELPLRSEKRWAHATSSRDARIGVAIARKHLAAFRPDLAFVWNGVHLPYAAIAAILASGTPTAFRVCEQWFSGLFSRDPFLRYLTPDHQGMHRMWSMWIRAANSRPSLRLDPGLQAPVAISWVSEYLRRSVQVPLGLTPVLERTVHAAPPSGAHFARVARRPAGRPLVTYAGRLSSEKGADVAIAALGLLRREGVGASLVLAGAGRRSDRRRLEHAARSFGVERDCRFTGMLDAEQLADLLARSWVLVVPSVWQEPMGLVVIEGALARVPIVASRVGGIPELVTDEEAILVPPGDPNALAAAVRGVLHDPDAASRRASRALERAKALSWDAYTRATAKFVDDAHAALA